MSDIERVAEAIYRSMGSTLGSTAPDDWDEIGPDNERVRAEWYAIARAAISALREPSEAMVEAIALKWSENYLAMSEGPDEDDVKATLSAGIAAAIDAALSE